LRSTKNVARRFSRRACHALLVQEVLGAHKYIIATVIEQLAASLRLAFVYRALEQRDIVAALLNRDVKWSPAYADGGVWRDNLVRRMAAAAPDEAEGCLGSPDRQGADRVVGLVDEIIEHDIGVWTDNDLGPVLEFDLGIALRVRPKALVLKNFGRLDDASILAVEFSINSLFGLSGESHRRCFRLRRKHEHSSGEKHGDSHGIFSRILNKLSYQSFTDLYRILWAAAPVLFQLRITAS
jgi:hypothetical protein